MATEIERKFLVSGDQWRSVAVAQTIRQGYIWTDHGRSLRVRIAGPRAFLTLKSARKGFSRHEYEYEIPLSDACEMLNSMCNGRLIEKTRYTVVAGGRTWVIDAFDGDNRGLIVAEIELENEEEAIDLPEWAGREVTSDPRYLNVNLVSRPYCLWSADECAPDMGATPAVPHALE